MSLLHLTDDRPTLAAVLWPQARMSPALRNAALALGGTVLLWLSAKIQIPLYPVPVTMQTLVVLVLGVAYGWRLGVATMALYLVEGAIGLPVFAGGWSEGAGFHNPLWPDRRLSLRLRRGGGRLRAACRARLGPQPLDGRRRPWSSAISSSMPWASPGSPSRSARPMRSNTA